MICQKIRSILIILVLLIIDIANVFSQSNIKLGFHVTPLYSFSASSYETSSSMGISYLPLLTYSLDATLDYDINNNLALGTGLSGTTMGFRLGIASNLNGGILLSSVKSTKFQIPFKLILRLFNENKIYVDLYTGFNIIMTVNSRIPNDSFPSGSTYSSASKNFYASYSIRKFYDPLPKISTLVGLNVQKELNESLFIRLGILANIGIVAVQTWQMDFIINNEYYQDEVVNKGTNLGLILGMCFRIN